MPSGGELRLEERAVLGRRVGHSTELEDVKDAEYRQLRLERVVLVGIWAEGTSREAEADMQELAALAETAGSVVLATLTQHRLKPDPSTYIGAGKVKELRSVIESTHADTVICDGELSPGQLIALEKAVNVKVIDRTALILDIFAQHATSREGKAQVSLAQMEYMLPRLRGWGESLSRQAGGRAGSNGGVGLRGPGETKIETDRRRIRDRMTRLRRSIADMERTRNTKRSLRHRNYIPSVAIVGYTNAGKSSLLNLLTGAGALVQDALFATLDPVTRRTELATGQSVIFTDTVGFVRRLPTQLVEAFRSTLEEVADTDLLIHVVDSSAPFPLRHIEAVNETIGEVLTKAGVQAPAQLMVINKVDVADPVTLAELRIRFPEAVFVSTKTGENIDELVTRIGQMLASMERELVLNIPFDRGDVIARIHEQGVVLETNYDASGTIVRCRVPDDLVGELKALSVN